jgi:steroid delta-isomerase-like uncharacterized protein
VLRTLVPIVLLLATLVIAGCASAPDRAEQDAQAAELAIRSLMTAWERDDVEMIQELFWPQATYDDFPNQQSHQGVQEIIAYVNTLHSWADDVLMGVGKVHVTESGAVAEWVLSAVQARPMGSQIPVATGLEVVTNGVTIIELQDGRIIRAADYFDVTPMLLQLGSRIELPGGGVLEQEVGR